MQVLFHALTRVPDLLRDLYTGKYAPVTIAITVLYLIAIFVNNKVTRVIREILVLAIVAAGVGTYFKRRYPFFWLMVILLAILVLVRLLSYFLVTIRINRRNKKIEKKALEKARMRRGSWKERRGYSGAPREDNAPARLPEMDRAEIRDVLDNETMEREGADIDVGSVPATEGGGTPAKDPYDTSQGILSRTVVMDALQKLDDLRAIGILTDEEYNQKRALLYSRMG